MAPKWLSGGFPEEGRHWGTLFSKNQGSRLAESISFETWLSWNGKRASVVRVSLLALLSLVWVRVSLCALLSLVWVRVSLLALLSLVCSLALVPVAWYFSLVCYLAQFSLA